MTDATNEFKANEFNIDGWVKSSSTYSGKIAYGKIIKQSKCYITVEFKKFFSNDNSKIVKLYKREYGSMHDYDSEYLYSTVKASTELEVL